MRLQYSLRTAAIIAAVFCCLLSIFPVKFGRSQRVTGMWIHSPRFWSPSKAMIGFVAEKFPDCQAYYIAAWVYEGTSVPWAVAYVVDSPAKRVYQRGLQIQTMRFPLTRIWSLFLWTCGWCTLTYPAYLLLAAVIKRMRKD